MDGRVRVWTVGFVGNWGVLVGAVNETEAIEEAFVLVRDGGYYDPLKVMGVRREAMIEERVHELVHETFERARR